MAPPTYAALSVGHLAPFPSPHALQWSTEGQLLVLTRSAIYILTPNLGLPFDEEATMGSRPPGSVGKSTEPVVKWFKTAVELENSMGHYWWDESSRSLSLCWQEVAWSPSNLSGNGGCLLVAMNSNHEVSLWAPDKNHLKGEWVKTQDVTSLIREVALVEIPDGNKGSSAGVHRVLYSQANCIAWSRQMDVGPPGRMMDTSLLAIGNRAGSVIFLRSNGTGDLEHVKTVGVSDHWVTQLAWSEWIEDGNGRCIGTLAFASADGGFSVISISSALEQDSDTGDFSPTFDFEHNGLLDVKDLGRRGITSMQWIFPSDGSQVLVYNKPGTVHLWWYTDSENEPRNTALRLKSPPLSSSASSLAPACAIIRTKMS
ncbi:hypothetical protein BS47DRAFT_743085 [Hydnum rufescens UP504]|uniref:Transcription factor IIIC 90kDa subunit N-terminal domain-containing protein n=1 Tax=Hydnum rufescens UP504 TaxID=1448309 RepID=A0A9P6B1F0_9AGAM|nr:hypothetical protein BS47DRAFT_743085 [Hydnum rufescens UP504]